MALYRTDILTLLLSGCIYYFLNRGQVEEVILKTSAGTLRGFKSLSREGKTIYNYKKIPYAQKPVGSLRFQPPVKAEKWEGILDATLPTPNCLQADTMWKTVSGQEDCLYLNIYTPQGPDSASEKLYPTIIFIHGGHFTFSGSDFFKPNYFLDEPVVLVTLQYRLGILGFLNDGEYIFGNMGLRDQLLAMSWIKEHIEGFGGLSDNIMIFGNSAGGASVHLHLISPLSSGFHRAIAESGTALCPWVDIRRDAQAQVRRLGLKLNCGSGNSSQLFKCINSTSGFDLVQTQTECFDIFHSPDAIYGPSFETNNSKNPFITEDIFNSYINGKSGSKIPWITGVNSEDGCYRTGGNWASGAHEVSEAKSFY